MWASNYGVGTTTDYDSDGLSNLYEYAMDGDPTDGLPPANLPVLLKSGNEYLYVHPQRSDDGNLHYTVETTTNLMDITSWTHAGTTVTGTHVTGGTLNFVTNRVDAVQGGKYIRLKVE